jgi:acetyl esterase
MLDEPTKALLAELAEEDLKPLHEMTPAEARAFEASFSARCGPGPQLARVQNTAIPGPDGASIPIRLFADEERAKGVIVYYHGGGWVVGGLDEYDTFSRLLCARTGCAVALIDYRLAPEHPYPAAVEDSWAALQWVASNIEEIAGEPAPLIVAGDSAGGNLAAIVTQRARDAGGPDIALQVLIYPVTDCDLDTPSYIDPDNQLLLDRDGMAWFWDRYVPDPSLRTMPDASPLRASDLSELPPSVVITAQYDVLRDEGDAYAKRLRDSGVPIEHVCFENQMHGFVTLINVLPASETGLDLVVAAIERQLSAAPDASPSLKPRASL